MFPPATNHSSPFYSAAAPLHWLLATAQIFLFPTAVITGIIALRRIRRSFGTEKGKILASIGIFIGGMPIAFTLILLLFYIFSTKK